MYCKRLCNVVWFVDLSNKVFKKRKKTLARTLQIRNLNIIPLGVNCHMAGILDQTSKHKKNVLTNFFQFISCILIFQTGHPYHCSL